MTLKEQWQQDVENHGVKAYENWLIRTRDGDVNAYSNLQVEKTLFSGKGLLIRKENTDCKN